MQSTLPRWVKSSVCERVVVLGVDDRVERLVAAALDLARRDEARVDRVAELGDHDEVVERCGPGFVTGFARVDRRLPWIRSRRGEGSNVAVPRGTVDPDDPPEFLVRLLRHLTTRRQDAHLVALADLAARQLDGLRHVPLEVQAERAPVGEGGDLALEIAGERGFPGS